MSGIVKTKEHMRRVQASHGGKVKSRIRYNVSNLEHVMDMSSIYHLE